VEGIKSHFATRRPERWGGFKTVGEDHGRSEVCTEGYPRGVDGRAAQRPCPDASRFPQLSTIATLEAVILWVAAPKAQGR
jgi:hypothetical protein